MHSKSFLQKLKSVWKNSNEKRMEKKYPWRSNIKSCCIQGHIPKMHHIILHNETLTPRNIREQPHSPKRQLTLRSWCFSARNPVKSVLILFSILERSSAFNKEQRPSQKKHDWEKYKSFVLLAHILAHVLHSNGQALYVTKYMSHKVLLTNDWRWQLTNKWAGACIKIE